MVALLLTPFTKGSAPISLLVFIQKGRDELKTYVIPFTKYKVGIGSKD